MESPICATSRGRFLYPCHLVEVLRTKTIPKFPYRSVDRCLPRRHRRIYCVVLSLVSVFLIVRPLLDSLGANENDGSLRNPQRASNNEGASSNLTADWDADYEILNDTSVLPPSARIVARKIFKDRPLVVWATEWHMTPIKDLENLLSPFGVEFLDYNLDPWRCEWHDCKAKERLKVLTSDNVLNAEPPLAEMFYEAYKDDAEMRSVDVVLCSYPASICEIYIPLNKSVLVLPTTRYDVGRYTADRWNKLNENLRILAQKPWNVFGGNNLYDAKYLQYYTGIETQHLPSVCDYTGAEYTNEIDEFLILRRRDRGFNEIFLEQFRKSCNKINCSVKTKMLEGMLHTYKDVAKYRGIVHVPYQISVMSIFEQYRMNIPMFFPSSELLARWQVDHYIMPERSFNGAFLGQRPNASVITPHPSQAGVPDPKNEYDYDSILYWMRFADFYQIMPHCFIYDSVDHLVRLLTTLNDETCLMTSSKMREHNVAFKKEIIKKWKAILMGYYRSNNTATPSAIRIQETFSEKF